jgi:hypothetical protein
MNTMIIVRTMDELRKLSEKYYCAYEIVIDGEIANKYFEKASEIVKELTDKIQIPA